MRFPLLALAAALVGCALPTVTPAQREVPPRWGPYSLDLVDEAGAVLPTFAHRGRAYVLGALGQRYLLRVRNQSARRVEVVASVDGHDVIDGRPSTFEKRGYLVEPWGELLIDGYRLSDASVAAFRFSSVPQSYAARKGDARDVGVIGMAVFPERWRRYVPPPEPYQPHPGPYPYPGKSPDRSEAPGASDQQPPAEAQADAGGAPPAAGAAPAPAPSRRAWPHEERRGLGTEFAEEHDSRVQRVHFERASVRPDTVLTLRYDDRAGLRALGIEVDRNWWAGRDEAALRETAEPFRRDPGYAEPPPGWRPW